MSLLWFQISGWPRYSVYSKIRLSFWWYQSVGLVSATDVECTTFIHIDPMTFILFLLFLLAVMLFSTFLSFRSLRLFCLSRFLPWTCRRWPPQTSARPPHISSVISKTKLALNGYKYSGRPSWINKGLTIEWSISQSKWYKSICKIAILRPPYVYV